MPRPVLSIEYSTLSFPSDRLTFAEIRKVEAELLAEDDPGGWHLADLEIIPAHLFERVLANKAFAQAIGQPDPHPDDNRLDLILGLHEAYVRYGISSGLQQSRQLIRQLETEAANQAKAACRGFSR